MKREHIMIQKIADHEDNALDFTLNAHRCTGKKGIFVTATGTDAGKTYVSAQLVKALREQNVNAGYFKPVLSGALRQGNRLVPGDAEFVCRVSGLPGPSEQYVTYFYEPAVSPHLAAQIENRPIEMERITSHLSKIQERFDYTVAEGCGGLFCPLRTAGEMDEDPLLLRHVAAKLGFDLLIVCPSGLGSIHAAVTTAEYAKRSGLTIHAMVMNRFEPGNPIHVDNRLQIQRFTGIPTVTIQTRKSP